VFLDGDRLVSVLPGAVAGDTYRSPAGASMGGFVLRRGAGLDLADRIVRTFVAWCAGEGIREAFIGQPMPIYAREPDDSGEYALLCNGFSPVDLKYSSVADLRLTGSRSAMSCKVRHNIVRSETCGVRIVDSDDFAVFHAILTENKRKFGCAPTHTLEELERIRELRPAMIRLFLAELEGKLVAGLMLFLVNPVCALDFYTAQDYRYHHCNPVSLLVEHAMAWCRDRGYRHFDYGVSMDTSSRNPLEVTRSLVRFKESLGCTGSIRRTYRRTIPRSLDSAARSLYDPGEATAGAAPPWTAEKEVPRGEVRDGGAHQPQA